MWQTIDNAPKDGSDILAATPYEGGDWKIVIALWDDNFDVFRSHYDPYLTDASEATLWMPVPIPPTKR